MLFTHSTVKKKKKKKQAFAQKSNNKILFYFRVSLTYRVKSAHKVKLTDKQLLQWMVPILLVMLIYLGTWTLSATPTAEEVIEIPSNFFFLQYRTSRKLDYHDS